jgi:hypothetical protein
VTTAIRLSRPNAGKDDDKDVENLNSIFHRISVAADRPITHFLKVLVKKGQRQIYIMLISSKGQECLTGFTYFRQESNKVLSTFCSKNASRLS